MRGKQRDALTECQTVRIIPAHAGQTHRLRNGIRPHTDHPRACGANDVYADLFDSDLGSSPRMRGKLGVGHVFGYASRIIPAHAGQTGNARPIR